MKAAQLDRYAKNFHLTVRDVPVPELHDDEVLIKVREAAVNPLDNLIGSGSLRLMQDYKLPVTMGNELSGEIEQVGSDVTEFNQGEAVYSRLPIDKIGAFAEFVAVPANAVSKLPGNLNFKSGAAAALTGLTAYQAFFEVLQAKPGQTVFIPGGSGSFGQLAIPIAKSIGLKIIVSGSARLREKTLQLGADQYISYETENYWKLVHNVDHVIDTLGPTEFEHELSIIRPGGHLLSLRDGPNRQFAIENGFSLAKRLLFSLAGLKFDRKAKQKGVTYSFIFVRSDGAQLEKISKIIEQNNVTPAVDPTVFHIDDINKALNVVATGHPSGRVLISF